MVNVLIASDSRYPISRPKIKRAVEELLKTKKISSDTEISVLVCGTRKIMELAKKYLHEDNSIHNVLSFPLVEDTHDFVSPTGKSAKGFASDKILVLGDIVVCYPEAQEEANRDNVRVDDKVNELVCHGLLHLLGIHHDEK